MPTFEFTTPSGTFEIDAPDEQSAIAAFSRTPEGSGPQAGGPQDHGHSHVPEFQPVGVEGYNPETGLVEKQPAGALSTALMSGAEGVPVIGPMLDSAALNMTAAGGSLLSGDSFSKVKGEMQGIRDDARAAHPYARMAGNVGGALATLGPLAGTRSGAYAFGLKGPNLATRTLAAGGSNAALAGADTLARGGSMQDAQNSAMLGAGIGAALPIVGNKLSQMGSKAAVAAAPSIDDLATAGRTAFETAKQSGIALNPKAYDGALWKMSAQLKNFGFDAEVQKNTAAVLNRLSRERGRPLSLQELHNLRKVAGNVVRGNDPADAEAARIIIDGIDELVDNAGNFAFQQTGMLGAPGANAVGMEGRKALQEGIRNWHVMRKSETVQELFRRAEIKAGSAKGPEYAKALRNEFKSLALRKNGLRGFTAAERRVIEQVAKGADSRQLTAAFGRFLRSLPAQGAGGFAGFSAGGGPVGAAATMAGLSAAGHGIEQTALRTAARRGISQAEKAAAFIRSGGATGGKNYAPNISTPLENAMRPAPLLTHDWGPR